MIAQNIKKTRHSLQSIIFYIILVILVMAAIAALIFANLKKNKIRSELDSRIESLKSEITDLEKENTELKSGLSQLESESTLEKEARERLNLKKPGENVVVVVPPKENTENNQTSKSFWQKLLEAIKSKF